MKKNRADKLLIRLAQLEKIVVNLHNNNITLSTHIARIYEAHPELMTDEMKKALTQPEDAKIKDKETKGVEA